MFELSVLAIQYFVMHTTCITVQTILHPILGLEPTNHPPPHSYGGRNCLLFEPKLIDARVIFIHPKIVDLPTNLNHNKPIKSSKLKEKERTCLNLHKTLRKAS